MKYIASVSFGKDSLCMLLLLLSKDVRIDEVIFYDTGMEFSCIYKIRDRIKEILKIRGIKYTELTSEELFEYYMFDKVVYKRDGSTQKGYSWCGGRCRWGTTMKNRIIRNYLKENYGNEYYEFVGIAYDEQHRMKANSNKIYPLVDYQFKESDCLKYCHDSGFNWIEDGIELYSVLDRVSCWCCSNKNLKELRNYYKYLPTYWNKLKDLQSKTNRNMKSNYSVFDLEERFKREEHERGTTKAS